MALLIYRLAPLLALTPGPSPIQGQGEWKEGLAPKNLTFARVELLHYEKHSGVTSPLPLLAWECEGRVRANATIQRSATLPHRAGSRAP